MTESPTKKQCVVAKGKDVIEVKEDPSKLEKEAVDKRVYATRRLIKVNTEPPEYLSTFLILHSPVLSSLTHLNMKDESVNDTNDYGDKCIISIDNDNIPRDTWTLFVLITENTANNSHTNLINNNTLDDILYICFKYDINFNYVIGSRVFGGDGGIYEKLLLVINMICSIKCKQYFPRTQNIPEIKKYYDRIGSSFGAYIISDKDTGTVDIVARLAYFEIIPNVHHAIVSHVLLHVLKK